jgi:hypothetical protein
MPRKKKTHADINLNSRSVKKIMSNNSRSFPFENNRGQLQHGEVACGGGWQAKERRSTVNWFLLLKPSDGRKTTDAAASVVSANVRLCCVRSQAGQLCKLLILPSGQYFGEGHDQTVCLFARFLAAYICEQANSMPACRPNCPQLTARSQLPIAIFPGCQSFL